MLREHKPPDIMELPDDEPIYFLAGPIQGAPDWQSRAIKLIGSMTGPNQQAYVANPRREYLDGTFDYTAQVKWEKHNLKRAAKSDLGGIAVWFAAQDHSLPYETGRRYAKTTTKELDRIFGWMDYDAGIHLSVGIEPGCKIDTERYIRTCAAEFELTVFNTLESVCMNLVGKGD